MQSKKIQCSNPGPSSSCSNSFKRVLDLCRKANYKYLYLKKKYFHNFTKFYHSFYTHIMYYLVQKLWTIISTDTKIMSSKFNILKFNSMINEILHWYVCRLVTFIFLKTKYFFLLKNNLHFTI